MSKRRDGKQRPGASAQCSAAPVSMRLLRGLHTVAATAPVALVTAATTLGAPSARLGTAARARPPVSLLSHSHAMHSLLPPITSFLATAGFAIPPVGPLTTQFLALAPPIAGQVTFISPLQSVRRFREEGTTGSASVLPYAAMVANGATWTTYGALSGDPTLTLPNVSCGLMGVYFCHQFYKYRSPDAVIMPYYCAAAAFSCAIIATAASLDTAVAQSVIGSAGVGVCLLMFGGPLASIKTVLKERSAAALPPAFVLSSAATCSLWSAYGILILKDPFIFGPNMLGLAASMTQLALIAKFGTGSIRPLASAKGVLPTSKLV